VWSYKTSIDNESLIQDIKELREEKPKGREGSNHGGWQSPLFSNYDEVVPKNIKNLEREVGAYVNTVCRDLDVPIFVHEMTWWANVNNRYDYNVLHHHTNSTDFIALYYPQLPENSGKFVLLRSDAGSQNAFNMNKYQGVKFEANPEVGRVYVYSGHLLHYVEPHRSDEERYSIAFNLCCKHNQHHKYKFT
jgi:uncharacterized protein (TIGR02466 family)